MMNHSSPPSAMASRPRPVALDVIAPLLADMPSQQPTPEQESFSNGPSSPGEALRNRYRKVADEDEHEQNLSIPASLRQSEDAVMPFLAEHIPMQYNPVGMASSRVYSEDCTDSGDQNQQHLQQQQQQHPRTSTKFCYRHQPGTKCRRTANEPDMDQLQNELATLSNSDQQAISHVWSLFSAAPSKHRELMLQGLLTQCCFPQLSYISASVRDLIKIDFLSALPAELGFKILCYLDTTSLCKAAQVSQRWRALADDDVVWHRMCEQHIDRRCTKCGWGLPLLERKRLRIEKRQIQLRATGRGLNQWSPNITPIPIADADIPAANLSPPASETSVTKRSAEDDIASQQDPAKRRCTGSVKDQETEESYFARKRRPWKDVYKDRFKVGTAWKHGRFSTRVFRGHTNGVMCLQFDDNTLISGSYDSTVRVWDVKTCKEIRVMKGHASGIRCLQFDDKKLLTGSLDGTLRLWNWKTGQSLRTFHAHEAGVLALHFVERFVASGSMDRTIRVWDAETKQTFLLRGHTDWVNSVKIDEPSRTLFSASDDLTIRIWDLDTKRCIQILKGHVAQVQQVSLLPAEFELDSRKTATAPVDKDDDASSVSSVTMSHRDSPPPPEPYWPNDPDRPAPPRYMLTGALDSTIRLWDVHFTPEKPVSPPTSDPSTSPAASVITTPATAPHSTTETGGTAPDHHPLPTDHNHHHHNNNTRERPGKKHNLFNILPTDPLTNSHTPRAAACVRTFFGHVEGIWALAADHLRMVSGSEDKMLKVWDPRTGKCERTFTGHAGPITCAWLTDSKIATGGEDCEVRMICFGEDS